MEKKEQIYPQEITFKAVYRTEKYPRESIISCFSEKGTKHEISEKPSGKGNFVSFTLTACFESEDHLNDICYNLKCIDGFVLMV